MKVTFIGINPTSFYSTESLSTVFSIQHTAVLEHILCYLYSEDVEKKSRPRVYKHIYFASDKQMSDETILTEMTLFSVSLKLTLLTRHYCQFLRDAKWRERKNVIDVLRGMHY